jgi:hypothetical protein
MSDPRDEEPTKRSFKVEDRRRFSDTGEARSEGDDRGDAARSEANLPPPPPQEAAQHDDHAAIPINFSTFVISLSTQALAHLGEIADPMIGRVSVDLIAAKQLIDMLGVLDEKTKGNLDQDEAALLEHCLYDLRLKYVELARRQGTPSAKP